MGTYRNSYKIVMGLLLLTPAWAQAEPIKPLAPLNVEAKYDVAWNGLTIGRINFSGHEEDGQYHMVIDTKTHGIGAMFSSEKRVAETTGRVGGGKYIPETYQSRPQGKDGGRVTTLTYDARGKIAERERVPDDDPEWRAPVPPAMLTGVTDPSTAGLILRRTLYEAQAHNIDEAAVKSYDGARLGEIKFAVVKPNARVEVEGEYKEAVNTVVTRQPIAGYTPKEMKVFKKGDPVIHLYFSADEQFLPLRATVSTLFGELSANLVEKK